MLVSYRPRRVAAPTVLRVVLIILRSLREVEKIMGGLCGSLGSS